MTLAETHPAAPAAARPDVSVARRRLATFLLLFCGLLALCAGIGVPSVARTQEARVLETAREMLGAGLDGWLVPMLNGNERLRKPPLAYWVTAASYKVLGVSEVAGRLPAALAGFLTVALTAAGASWLFGHRAAFFAGASLLGSYLFFRHSRLAETDGLAALFVTAATLALWRGFDETGDESRRGRAALWFHLAALAMALAVLSKGPPAVFPVLFLLTLCAVERQWRPLWRFVTSGAPLTAAAVALPWFLYVAGHPMAGQLGDDLRNSAEGGKGHETTFLTYGPQLIIAAAPWSPLVVAALVAGVYHWRKEPRVRGVIVWVASVLVPLCLWGNKQVHYLITVMPPLMLLLGWFVDAALSPDGPLLPLARRVWLFTCALFVLLAAGPLIAGHKDRGFVAAVDVTVSVAVGALAVGTFLLYRARGLGAALKAFAVGTVACLILITTRWSPSLEPVNARDIASTLRARYGDGPYAFSARPDLPLVFHLRRIVPAPKRGEDLRTLQARHPNAVFIEMTNSRRQPDPALAEELRFEGDEALYRVGHYVGPPPPPQQERHASSGN